MGHFARQLLGSILGSYIIPASFRCVLMNALGFRLSSDTCIWSQAIILSNKMQTGTGVFINVGFFFDGYENLTIGDNVRMGQFVRIITASHEIGPCQQRCEIDVSGGPVIIGGGCWIGAGVIILPGITIAPGCVIAANSLVNKSTESNGLYAGSPARLIRRLP